MFTELHGEMTNMLVQLKKYKSIEKASRAQYHLNTYLQMFKIHLDQLNYLFSPHNHDGKKEMLKKETKELDISLWERELLRVRRRAKEEAEKKAKEEAERKARGDAPEEPKEQKPKPHKTEEQLKKEKNK